MKKWTSATWQQYQDNARAWARWALGECADQFTFSMKVGAREHNVEAWIGGRRSMPLPFLGALVEAFDLDANQVLTGLPPPTGEGQQPRSRSKASRSSSGASTSSKSLKPHGR